MFSLKPQRFMGFTLAELLVALLILGEIATFTIPKILNSQQNGQRIAVFKETYSTISELTYRGYLMGSIAAGSNGGYLRNNMNSVKICPDNSSTQGCWTQPGDVTEAGEPGLILHNGATISGLNDSPGGPGNAFLIDWNGPASPNIEGTDQLFLLMCYGSSPCSTLSSGSTVKPGTVGPYTATSMTLYLTLFQ